MKEKKQASLNKQIQLRGIPAAPGIAIGKAHVFGTEEIVPPQRDITEAEIPAEIMRFKDVLAKTRKEILAIEKKISKEMGVEHGKIFSAHLLVLEDSMLVKEVISRLAKRKKNIEAVFAEVLDKYISVLSEAKDEYLRDRIADITDVGKRILGTSRASKKRAWSSLRRRRSSLPTIFLRRTRP